MMKKISDRAKFLLWWVSKKSIVDWGTGEISCYFVPSAYNIYYSDNGEQVTDIISGGDGASLKALENRGLIRRPETCPKFGRYYYVITEAGMIAIEEMKLNSRFSNQ